MGKKNILLVQVDQLHAGLLSCAGHPDVKTPNIDRIAAGGVRFSNAFCPTAICQASRVAMFTGLSCHTTGDYENSGLIRPDLYSLVRHLSLSGYQTGMIGKAHFIPQWPGHGFEIVKPLDFCDCNSVEENLYYKYLKSKGVADIDFADVDGRGLRLGKLAARPSRLPLELTQEHVLAHVTRETLESRDQSRPFFLHVSFSRPHNPWLPSAPFDSMYNPADLALPPTDPDDWKDKPFNRRDRWLDERLVFHYPSMTPEALRRALALYYGLISQVDNYIGKILDTVSTLGLEGDTVVAFCSDHGDFAGEHGIIDKGIPTLDAIWRTPMIIGGAGADLPRGEVRDQLVNLIDLMPTLLEAAGVVVPENIEGRTLSPEISNAGFEGRDAVFFEYRHVKTVRTREYAMSYYSPGEPGRGSYAHSSTWAVGGELYDLKKDPNQFRNVYNRPEYAAVRLALTERLLEWFCNTERVHRCGLVVDERHGLKLPCSGMPLNELIEEYGKAR